MTGWRLKTGFYAALALAAGVALRLWFVGHAARVDGDTLLYGNIARNWMEHGVYSFTPSPNVPVPTLIRLPGYPLFLMACFRVFGVEHYTAAMYVQCVVDLGTWRRWRGDCLAAGLRWVRCGFRRFVRSWRLIRQLP